MNYLEQIIHQMPGIFWITDENSRFLTMNQRCSEWTGFKRLQDGIGVDYSLMKCRAVELVDALFEEDARILQQGGSYKYLSYVCYARNSWRLVMGEKKYFCEESTNSPQIMAHFMELTDLGVVDVFPFMRRPDGSVNKQQFVVNLLERYPSPAAGYLSVIESECLFFLLRGKTHKQIADLLDITPRRIEQYIYGLKVKFKCFSKGELIERALDLGYLNFIPETLFRSQSQFKGVVEYS